jgi:hypothetical protein
LFGACPDFIQSLLQSGDKLIAPGGISQFLGDQPDVSPDSGQVHRRQGNDARV